MNIDLSWLILAPIGALVFEVVYALCVAAGLRVPEQDDDDERNGWVL